MQKWLYPCAKPSKTLATQTSDPDANRLFHRPRSPHQQNFPQGTEGHGHEIPLDKMLRSPRSIPILLETGNTTLGRQLTKHHPTSHHKSFCSQILTSPSDPEYAKLLTLNATSTKFCYQATFNPQISVDIYKVFEHIDMLSMAYISSLTHLYPPYLAQILGFWVPCGVNMMSLYHG
jgi:hypothetical protein